MKKTLLQIANTIVANQSNTTIDGLVNGKMGISLFLYEYSRISGYDVYGGMAKDIADDVYRRIQKYLAPGTINVLGEIGIATVRMIASGHIDNEDDNSTLRKIDNIIYRFPAAFSKGGGLVGDLHIYPSGFYVLQRMTCFDDNFDSGLCRTMVEETNKFLHKYIASKDATLDTGICNSILYTFCKLGQPLHEAGIDVGETVGHAAKIIMRNLENNEYTDKDVFIIRNIIDKCKAFMPECHEELQSWIDKHSKPFSMDTYYKNSWEMYLYDIDPLKYISLTDLSYYVGEKAKDMFYDMHTANSMLSGLGMSIIKHIEETD